MTPLEKYRQVVQEAQAVEDEANGAIHLAYERVTEAWRGLSEEEKSALLAVTLAEREST